MSDAACLEYPSETFFPEKGNTAVSREAKRICGGCLVRDVCLAYALERGERWGVWGGLSETERRMLARRSGIRRSTGRKDPRPRTHLCPVVGCGYAGPTADALSSHRYKKHRVVEGAA